MLDYVFGVVSKFTNTSFLFLAHPFHFIAMFFKTPSQIIGSIFESDPKKFENIRRRMQIRIALTTFKSLYREAILDFAELKLNDVNFDVDLSATFEKLSVIVKNFSNWQNELRFLENEIDPIDSTG